MSILWNCEKVFLLFSETWHAPIAEDPRGDLCIWWRLVVKDFNHIFCRETKDPRGDLCITDGVQRESSFAWSLIVEIELVKWYVIAVLRSTSLRVIIRQERPWTVLWCGVKWCYSRRNIVDRVIYVTIFCVFPCGNPEIMTGISKWTCEFFMS